MKLPILRLHFLIILGLFFSTHLDAQTNVLDSLENSIQKNTPDSVKLITYYQLASVDDLQYIDKSILYTEKLLTLSQKMNNDLYIGVAYNQLASHFFNKNYGLDTIIAVFQKGMKQAKIANSIRLKAVVSNGMAMTYDKFGQKEKALDLYQQAYTILYESGDKASAIRSLGNVALVLKNNDDLGLAKEYYLKAIEIAQEIDDQLMVSQLGHNLASVYYEQNDIDSALTLYKKALDVNKAAGDKYFTALSLANIGRVYNKKKQYKTAYSYLDESYQVALKMNDNYCLGIALTFLCENYYQQKQYSKTINAANEALKTLGENSDILTRKAFYNHLSNSYEAQGNYTAAFKNQKLYHTLSDSIYNVEKSKQINDLKIQYEVVQKETENQLLKTQQETSVRTIRNRGYIAIGLIVALLLAVGWGTTFYRSNQQKKKHNKELTATVAKRTADLQIANENLAQMNKDLEQANYELRTFNYIASHDIKEPIRVIGGYIGLIFRQLPDDLKVSFGEYFDTIKRSTTQLYTLIEDFAQYTVLSKGEAIETKQVDLNLLIFNVIDNLKETIEKYKGTVEISDFPIIQSSNALLFTTFKNLVENGLKYNKSDNPIVKINYMETENHHKITVSDNGIGIDKNYHQKVFEMFKRLHNRGAYEGSGIGLAIVKLSIDKLNGKIDLESKKGKGSTFIISLPK